MNRKKSGEKLGLNESIGSYGRFEESLTDEDIDLLLAARASFYGRLSDECLYDVRRIDDVVKRLGRSRYKKDGAARFDTVPQNPNRASD